MTGAIATGRADRAAVEEFLLREARLLDDGRFEDWLALFDEDGLYWIPGLPGQTDRFGAVSIVHEDRSVLRMRVRRLGHPRAWSLMPLPRTAHMLGSVTVAPAENGAVEAVAALQVVLYRAGDRARYDGRQTMRLRPDGGSFRIVLKRIDLIDCDGVHGVMPVPI
ncbi:MAG: aromatic-ring-hydroxylating dioxygenase subunit beta [Rhodospirillaceae bacterium]|nr:aromatic-ring-hydroxylating dioxygenase subunit beta [Rhodospirillaceae bacterium]